MSPRGKTHKRRGNKKTLTIPQLRKSLDHIHSYASHLAKSGASSQKEKAAAFSDEWYKTFGKRLDKNTAESYVAHVMSTQKKSSAKKTRRNQRGGMAPLDYLTRPGVDLPYGKFLDYVDKGFWNPEPAPAADCPGFKTVLPYAGTGSNRMSGGGIMSTLSNGLNAIGMRPFVAQNPPSIQQDAATAWRGQALGPGPEAWQSNYAIRSASGPATLVPNVGVYTRAMSADVTSATA